MDGEWHASFIGFGATALILLLGEDQCSGGAMSWLEWEEGREEREAAALENHQRLHRLFVEDRLAFERERRRAIDDLINSVEEEGQRERLREQQALWDKRMKHAGSPHNRFVLAQTFFWDHLLNNWLPAVRRLNELATGVKPVRSQPEDEPTEKAP
jgi:hypothetical protein